MAKLPIDDILKAIAKQLANKGNQKARYTLMQKTKGIAKGASSPIGGKPKPKVKPKAKSKPKGTGTTDNRPVGRIAKTKPERPTRDYYRKGKTIPQTASEQRAAERMGNRMLRNSGLVNGPKPPTNGAKPVDVRGSIIQPPSKATMRPSKPRGSSPFEADPMRRAMGEDKAAGLTKRTPKKQKAKPKVKNQPKGTKPNPPAKKTPVAKNTKPRTSSRPKGNVKPQTPAQRGAASKRAADRKNKKSAIENQIPMTPRLKLLVENERLRRNGARAFDNFPDTLK